MRALLFIVFGAALCAVATIACGVKGMPRPTPAPMRPETLPGQPLPGERLPEQGAPAKTP